MSEIETSLQNAVERLSEDERLRGELSDVGFGPLLDWANAALEAFAKRPDAANNLETYSERIKAVIEATVEAAQSGKIATPDALLDFEAANKSGVLASLQGLELGPDADDNAVKLAAILQTGLEASQALAQPVATKSVAGHRPKITRTRPHTRRSHEQASSS